jgi:hypothetical protein
MGAWSDTLPSSCSLEGILADSADFIQYRAVLSTTDLLLSPILHDVTVEWCPYTGTHEDPGIGSTEFKLLGAVPNPALGHAAVSFSMPVDSWVELKVFDLAGRIVRQIDGEYNSGVHEVLFDGISSGVYLVRMTSSEFTATRRFVLMD